MPKRPRGVKIEDEYSIYETPSDAVLARLLRTFLYYDSYEVMKSDYGCVIIYVYVGERVYEAVWELGKGVRKRRIG